MSTGSVISWLSTLKMELIFNAFFFVLIISFRTLHVALAFDLEYGPHKQGLSETKTFANASLIKRFTYTALNRSVLLPLTAANSQPIQCKAELPPENLPN